MGAEGLSFALSAETHYVTVGKKITGVLAKLQIAPELKDRLARVAADCDAEIIR